MKAVKTTLSPRRILAAFALLAMMAGLVGCQDFFTRPDQSGPVYIPPPDPPVQPPPDPPVPAAQ